MKIVVIGGSGLIGSKLVSKLRERLRRLSAEHPRWGYRLAWSAVRAEGWAVKPQEDPASVENVVAWPLRAGLETPKGPPLQALLRVSDGTRTRGRRDHNPHQRVRLRRVRRSQAI